jgi:uncharacterized protein with HEPN domain
MSSRKPILYLEDIQQACDDILNFTQNIKSAEDLQNDRRTFLAVVRCLEIIGEAARQMRVPVLAEQVRQFAEE